MHMETSWEAQSAPVEDSRWDETKTALPYGVGSVSIIVNAQRETHQCKHKDSQIHAEQFTNIFDLQMHADL